MPKTRAEIIDMLERLNECVADDLEGQNLDFKEWDRAGTRAAVKKMVAAAVCMANGGGGTIVFGVVDRVTGRGRALVGVPDEVDVSRLRRAVYDGTEPKLTPEFSEIRVPEGTGRLIAMHIHPGMPPYTDASGRGAIRVGKDCQPLTGTIRMRLMEGSREGDFTGVAIRSAGRDWLSAPAIQALRIAAAAEEAPDDLLGLDDDKLLRALGVLDNDGPTRAALLLAGTPTAIRAHVPNYFWKHLRMSSDTEYSDAVEGNDAVPVALERIFDRIMADNPIETVRREPYHNEYRTYPPIALREALLNALCHASYRIASPIIVRQYADRIEVANPGGLIGGITPDNILHHRPVARNGCLVGALARLRLVNRSSLGVRRIYKSFLIEGKPPPRLRNNGEGFHMTLRASRVSPAFRAFVADEATRGVSHTVGELLVLRHLVRHWWIGIRTGAHVCQLSRVEVVGLLERMHGDLGYLAGGGEGPGRYWALRPGVFDRITDAGGGLRSGRTDGPTVRVKLLGVVRERAEQRLEPLANADFRRITGLDRQRVARLMRRLREEGRVRIDGQGRGTRYVYEGPLPGGD